MDITARKQAEEALQTNRRQLAQAMDLAGVVNWGFDVARNRFVFNDRFCALYGTTAQREGGNEMPPEVYLREFVHPDDVGLIADELRKALDAANPQCSGQVQQRILRRDGQLRHCLVLYEVTRDASGRALAIWGSNQDVTKQKQTEQMLRIERESLKAILAAAPVGMLLLDEDTMIVDANSTLAAMVSRNLGQIIYQRGGGGLGCSHSFEDARGCGHALACPKCPLRNGIMRLLADGVSIRGAEIQPTLLIEGQEHRPWLSQRRTRAQVAAFSVRSGVLPGLAA